MATSGGGADAGQVFHYLPTSAEAGELKLVFESPSRDILDSPDNIAFGPHGGLVLCEDGRGVPFIRELNQEGQIVTLVRGVGREFGGACFSPDGRVLFFNVQAPNARTGAWRAPPTRSGDRGMARTCASTHPQRDGDSRNGKHSRTRRSHGVRREGRADRGHGPGRERPRCDTPASLTALPSSRRSATPSGSTWARNTVCPVGGALGGVMAGVRKR